MVEKYYKYAVLMYLLYLIDFYKLKISIPGL